VSQGTTIEQQTQQQQKVTDPQGRPAGNRSQLVQRLLDHSVNLPAFVHDLLQTQAVTVAGTEAAAFLIERAPPAAPAEGEVPGDVLVTNRTPSNDARVVIAFARFPISSVSEISSA